MESNESKFEEVQEPSQTQTFLHRDALDEDNLSKPPPFGTGSPAADVRKSIGIRDEVCDYVPTNDHFTSIEQKMAGVRSSCFKPATHLAYISERYPEGLGLDEDPRGHPAGKDHGTHFVCADHAHEAAEELTLSYLDKVAHNQGVDVADIDLSKIRYRGRAEPLSALPRGAARYFDLGKLSRTNIGKYVARRRGVQTPSAEELTIPQVPDQGESQEDFYDRRESNLKKRSNYINALRVARHRLRKAGEDVPLREPGRRPTADEGTVEVTTRNLRGAATDARGIMLAAGISTEKLNEGKANEVELRPEDITAPTNPRGLATENERRSPFFKGVFGPHNDPTTMPFTLSDTDSGGRVNLGAWLESLKATQDSLEEQKAGDYSETAGYGAPENDEDDGNKDTPDTQATVDIDRGSRRIRPGLANFTAKVHHTGDPMAWDPVRNKAYMLRLEPKGMKKVGQQLRSYVDPGTGETHGTSGDVNYWQPYDDGTTRPMQSAPQHEWIISNAEALDEAGNPYTLEKMQDADLYSSKQERQMRDITNPEVPGYATRASNFMDRLKNLREESTAICAQCDTKIRGTSRKNAASGLLAHHVLQHGLSKNAAEDMMRSRQFSDTTQLGTANE
jgi:hypothetical protein